MKFKLLALLTFAVALTLAGLATTTPILAQESEICHQTFTQAYAKSDVAFTAKVNSFTSQDAGLGKHVTVTASYVDLYRGDTHARSNMEVTVSLTGDAYKEAKQLPITIGEVYFFTAKAFTDADSYNNFAIGNCAEFLPVVHAEAQQLLTKLTPLTIPSNPKNQSSILLGKENPQLFAVLFLGFSLLNSMVIVVGIIRTLKSQYTPRFLYVATFIFVFGLLALAIYHPNFAPILPVAIVAAVVFICLSALTWWRRHKAYTLVRDAIVIPTFQPPAESFLCVPIADHGYLRDADLLAMIAYYKLNPQRLSAFEKGVVSKIQMNDIRNIQGVIYWHAQGGANSYIQILTRIVWPIFKQMRSRGYVVYEPRLVALFTVLFLGVSALMVSVLTVINILVSLTTLTSIYTGFVVVFFVCLMIITFATAFHENIKNISALRREIKGYKMFLERVDYYKVDYDDATFRKSLPYLISFRLRGDRVGELIKRVLQEYGIGK
jgi:hypothetical protein